MGPDKSNLTKARNELEELYSGIPDDSVNLTFQDLAEVTPPHRHPSEKNKTSPQMEAAKEASPRTEEVSPLASSLDFSRGFEVSSRRSDHPIHHKNPPPPPHVHPLQSAFMADDSSYPNSPAIHHLHHAGGVYDHHHGGGASGLQYGHPYMIGGQTPTDSIHYHYGGGMTPYSNMGFSPAVGASMYDDMSRMSGVGDRRGRRRPGIPHSNICTVCSTYIYIFRHRCLVCGRVYCRQCVSIGMGEMSEGRKCIECLGRRFSHRYIQRAGQVGCWSGYPSIVKQQELKWAEKGPRKSGENRYGEGGMTSRAARSHVPSTPGLSPSPAQSSYVMNSPYSPYYVPTNQPLPF